MQGIEANSAKKFIEGNSAEKFIKVHSHITCVRFSLISAVPFLKMQNVNEHNHLFLYSPYWTSDANANADVTCEQGFNCSMYFVSLWLFVTFVFSDVNLSVCTPDRSGPLTLAILGTFAI